MRAVGRPRVWRQEGSRDMEPTLRSICYDGVSRLCVAPCLSSPPDELLGSSAAKGDGHCLTQGCPFQRLLRRGGWGPPGGGHRMRSQNSRVSIVSFRM